VATDGCDSGLVVEFLTGREVARLDEDDVLNCADYWREGGRP